MKTRQAKCKQCGKEFTIEILGSGRSKEYCSDGCKETKHRIERKKQYEAFRKWRMRKMNRLLHSTNT